MTEPVSKLLVAACLCVARRQTWHAILPLGYPVLLCLIPLLFSCGRKPPPDPPRTIPVIVLETIDALQSGDHKLALVKVERLIELAPTSVFLVNLEILEKNNVIIVEAQRQIDIGNLQGALAIVNESIIKHGRHADLLSASSKLALAVKTDEILQVFKAPRDSAQLLGAAAQLKEIASSYTPASPFMPLVEEKAALAKKMAEWESARAIESFCSYLDQMLDKTDPDIDVLFAVLEIEDPLNHTLLNYLYNMNENQNLPLKTFGEEGIFSSEISDSESKTIDDHSVTEPARKNVPSKDKNDDNKGWWNRFSF